MGVFFLGYCLGVQTQMTTDEKNIESAMPTPMVPPIPTNSSSTGSGMPSSVGPGQHCGGNMANAPVCADGLRCVPQPGVKVPFGDVGGICAL